jgi:hypothetical protein
VAGIVCVDTVEVIPGVRVSEGVTISGSRVHVGALVREGSGGMVMVGVQVAGCGIHVLVKVAV